MYLATHLLAKVVGTEEAQFLATELSISHLYYDTGMWAYILLRKLRDMAMAVRIF